MPRAYFNVGNNAAFSATPVSRHKPLKPPWKRSREPAGNTPAQQLVDGHRSCPVSKLCGLCATNTAPGPPPPAGLTLTKTEILPSSSQACHQRAALGDTDGLGVVAQEVCWLCGEFSPICGISQGLSFGPTTNWLPSFGLSPPPLSSLGVAFAPFFRHPKFCTTCFARVILSFAVPFRDNFTPVFSLTLQMVWTPVFTFLNHPLLLMRQIFLYTSTSHSD